MSEPEIGPELNQPGQNESSQVEATQDEPGQNGTGQAENSQTGSAGPPVEPRPASRAKVLGMAAAAIVVIAALYFIDQHWIKPAVTLSTAKGSGAHPMAPEFSLKNVSGGQLNLADYRGKVVLLDFWATWCGPCRIEIPGFVELQQRYRNEGFTVIGVLTEDDPANVPEFQSEMSKDGVNMNYPIAVGDDRLGELYGGFVGLPTTFVIGRDGRIYAKHEGAAPVSVFEKEVKELLAASANTEENNFQAAGGMGSSENIDLGDPDAVNSEVPGINLTKLTAAQKAEFEKRLEKLPCTCGCKNPNVLECRKNDRNCSVSLKIAQDELAKMLGTAAPGSQPESGGSVKD